MCHMSGVTCQVSGVRCQVSHVRCQVSGVTCHIFLLLFLDIEVELVGGGSVINGAYPVYFIVLFTVLCFCWTRLWCDEQTHWLCQGLLYKLDGVGPVDNRPSPDKLHHFVKNTQKNMTPDTWHMTPDTWNLTYDTWHVTHGGGWTFSQNFSSQALTVWV